MPFVVLDPTTAAAAPSTSLGAPKTSQGETLLSLRTELASLLMGRSDVAGDSARLNKWINRGYRSICDSLRLQELTGSLGLSLVADQPYYLLPIQVSFIERISIVDTLTYLSGGRELTKIDLSVYRHLDDDTDPPTKYFRHNRMVVVWPTPDASYTAAMDFKIRPDDLVQDTDSPIIPQEFHEGVVLAAKAKALRDLSMMQEAMLAENDVLKTIRPLLDTDAEESATVLGVASPARRLRDIYRKG